MDPATGIGIGLTLVAIFASIILDGGNPMAIILIPSLVLVFGGTIGAAVAGGVLSDAKAMPKQLIRGIKAQRPTSDATVETLIRLAERARREGLLALESETAGIEEPFLRRGLQMAVDGIDSEEVADILSGEIETKRTTDKRAAKPFQDMGGYAPTIGIIGTVLGLIHVLGNLGEPAELGKEIAGAFVATLWGVLSANVFWFPIHNRLRRISDLECDQMELILEGILAIQAGSNPRLVAQKLQSLLPADVTPAKDDDAREVA
jgi:chemotaxis protein MotA